MNRLPLLAFLLAVLSLAVAPQQPPSAPRYEINGTVVDHLSNHPIARALVRLSPLNGPEQLTSLTGGDGRFSFTSIPKGKYRLAAQRRGQAPQAWKETGQYSTAIVVGPGLDTSDILFALSSPAAISCLALDEDGEPLQSANVLLFHERVVEGEKQTVQIENGSTNSLGQFRAGQLPPGAYYAAVQGSTWTFGMQQQGTQGSETDVVYPLTFYGDTRDAQAAAPIALTEGTTAQIQVTLRPAPNIHVRIPPQDPSGQNWMPQLFLPGPGGVRIPANVAFINRNHEGSELSGLPAGRYIVQLFSGRPGQRSRQLPPQEVELSDGAPFVVPEPPKGGTISGRVVFDSGQQPSNEEQLYLQQRSDQITEFTQVTPDGLIKPFENVAPGLYSIQLTGGQTFIKSFSAKGARIVGDKLEVTEGSSATLSIVATPAENLLKLDGFVLRDGKPVPGAMVLLVPNDINRSTLFRRDQSDSDGSFSMAAILPGRYTLLAIDNDGRGLPYKDPAVIQRYFAAGQTLTFPLHSTEPVKLNVQPRLS